MLNKKNILNVGITDGTKNEILEYVIKNLENFKKKLFLATPNPEFLVLANKNSRFKNILNKADLALADGLGIIIAAKFLGKDLKGRFTGVDLVKILCKEVSEKPITVGFLGGKDEAAEKTAECLQKKHPKLKISFVGEEWPNNVNARQPRVSDDAWLSYRDPAASFLPASVPSTSPVRVIGSPFFSGIISRIDILFVAFGAPKQEFWINENLQKIPVKIAIGVGGAFDYISGKVPRAPGFVRNIGLEWLFRLTVQPWRIKRQLSLIEFIWLVLKEKINKSSATT